MKTVKLYPTLLAAGTAAWLLAGCVVAPGPPGAVVVGEAPPAPEVEVVPVAPGPGYVWIGGYWTWHDHWVWAPGYWAVRPAPRARWAPGGWVHERRGWAWRPGRWR